MNSLTIKEETLFSHVENFIRSVNPDILYFKQ